MRKTKIQPATTACSAARSNTCLPQVLALVLLFTCLPVVISAQQRGDASDPSSLTPLQLQIEKQRQRMKSSETEERRDAVMRLGAMGRAESSRVASFGLRDSAAIVRATAARAVLQLAPHEAASLLLTVVHDRDEFVRQEVAYALGETQSMTAVDELLLVLEKDKADGVRAAAAVALGRIGDPKAVLPLTQALGRRVPASGLINRVRRSKKDENEFVRRAAARSLGQLRSRAAVPALRAVVTDEKAPDDVRREAANSLGLIGDPSAVPALRSVLSAGDPYLSDIASEALRKIASSEASRQTTGGATFR
jgi:HEAT repeat protein